MKIEVTEDIIEISGSQDGPHVAIFAGIHGNERAGILALQEVIPKLKLKRGKVSFAFGNPPAIAKNERMLSKNLNRCFQRDNQGDAYEDKRARELMDLLDECDGLLDLHAFREYGNEPFIICDSNSIEIARTLDPIIVTTGWEKSEYGASDEYMQANGKIGICLETGPVTKMEEGKKLAVKSIFQFLKYFDMVDSDVALSEEPKKFMQIEKVIKRHSKDYYLDPNLINFQRLEEGQIIGNQDSEEYVAKDGQYIIFPQPNAKIDTEAFILARDIGIPLR